MRRARRAIAIVLALSSGLAGIAGCSDGSGHGDPGALPDLTTTARVTVDGDSRLAEYQLGPDGALQRLSWSPDAGSPADASALACSGSFSGSYECVQTGGATLAVARTVAGAPVAMNSTDPRNPEVPDVPIVVTRSWGRSGDAWAQLDTLSSWQSHGFGASCRGLSASLQRESGRLVSLSATVSSGSTCTMSTIPLSLTSTVTIDVGPDGLPSQATSTPAAGFAGIGGPQTFSWKYESGRVVSITATTYDALARVVSVFERTLRYDDRGNVTGYRWVSRRPDGSIAEQFAAAWHLRYRDAGAALQAERLEVSGTIQGRVPQVGVITAIEYAEPALPTRPCLAPRPPTLSADEDLAYSLYPLSFIDWLGLPGCPSALPWLPL